MQSIVYSDILWSSIHTLKNSIFSLIVYPVEYLYIHGPHWLGFWEGIDNSDICAGLTSVPSQTWNKNQESCNNLIYRHSYANLLGLIFLGSLLGIHASCYACSVRYALKNK